MEFTESILYSEVQEIFKNEDSKTNYTWEADIYYAENEFIVPLKIISVGIRGDYITNYADEITCSMLVPLGKFARRIYPNRKNIRVVLRKKMLAEQVSKTTDVNASIAMGTFSAIILNDDQSVLEGQGREADSEDFLDLNGFVELQLQLIDINIEKLRTVQTGGIYNRFKVEDLLKTVIPSVAKDLIKGLTLLKPSNLKEIPQLIIPHSTLLLMDLVSFIQKKIGIYNSGVGSYIKDGNWFIYYLYDVSKLDDRSDTINIIVVPQNKFPNIERSYKNINGDKTIVVSGKTTFKDDNGIDNINEGHGARISNANNMLDGAMVNKGNKTLISRAKMNSEFVGTPRPNDINFAPPSKNKIQSNPFVEFSELNRRSGSLFSAVWQSADYSLLTPGVPAKIHYCDDDGVKMIKGILIDAKYASMMSDGITGTKYNNQAILTFYINKTETT